MWLAAPYKPISANTILTCCQESISMKISSVLSTQHCLCKWWAALTLLIFFSENVHSKKPTFTVPLCILCVNTLTFFSFSVFISSYYSPSPTCFSCLLSFFHHRSVLFFFHFFLCLLLPPSPWDLVSGWDWSPTSVIYYYIPVFILSTNKTTVASSIWSWCVGCCCLFYYLCISLRLSAQLYSFPHCACVHPLLPSLSLPLFTPLNLSFTLHPPFSLPALFIHTYIRTSIKMHRQTWALYEHTHTHLHSSLYSSWGLSPLHSPSSGLFSLSLNLSASPSNLAWHHTTFWASAPCLIPSWPLCLNLELCSLVSASSSKLFAPQLSLLLPCSLLKIDHMSPTGGEGPIFSWLLLKTLIANGILGSKSGITILVLVMVMAMMAMVRTYPLAAVYHRAQTRALFVLNGLSPFALPLLALKLTLICFWFCSRASSPIM